MRYKRSFSQRLPAPSILQLPTVLGLFDVCLINARSCTIAIYIHLHPFTSIYIHLHPFTSVYIRLHFWFVAHPAAILLMYERTFIHNNYPLHDREDVHRCMCKTCANRSGASAFLHVWRVHMDSRFDIFIDSNPCFPLTLSPSLSLSLALSSFLSFIH